jgi:dTDP-4-dehydrorhamnose 3,5-epimerase
MTLAYFTIQDLVIINPAVFNDERGYFFGAYNQAKFHENRITYNFIQDNQSFSTKGDSGYIYKLTLCAS